MKKKTGIADNDGGSIDDHQSLLADVLAHAGGKGDVDINVVEKEKVREEKLVSLFGDDLKEISSPLPDRLRPMASVKGRPEDDESVVSAITMQANQSLFRGPLYPALNGATEGEDLEGEAHITGAVTATNSSLFLTNKSSETQQNRQVSTGAVSTKEKLQVLKLSETVSDDFSPPPPREQSDANVATTTAVSTLVEGSIGVQPMPTGNANTRPRHLSNPGAFPMPGVTADTLSPSLEMLFQPQPDLEQQVRSPRPQYDDDLVEARAVMDESHSINIHGDAEKIDLEEKDRRRKQEQNRQSNRILLMLFAVLFLLGAIIIALVLGLPRASQPAPALAPSAAPTTAAPSAAPTAAPSSVLDTFVDVLPNKTLESLMDINSPQSKAYTWLIRHQSIGTMPQWRKIQLFALGTVFYALEGPHWPDDIRKNWMDDDKNECYWFSNLFGAFEESTGLWQEGVPFLFFNDTQCNQKGEFTSITLTRLKLAEHKPFLPPEIALLTSLTSILLDKNDIHHSGPTDFIPHEIGQLSHLEFFRLWDNKIAGTIPSEFGLLTKMSILDFDGNNFHGSMPTELFQLTALEELWLNHNSVTGTIPSDIGMMQALVLLELTGNPISGTIPTELGLLDKMNSFSFAGNTMLSGTIPTEVGAMASLEEIWISKTKVSGQLPSELGLLSTMDQIMIAGNFLTGTIPTELGTVAKMRQLSLSNNYLSGTIPTEIGLLKHLFHLDLSNSFLSGPIPASELAGLVSNHNLSFVNISSNKHLEGSIPDALCKLRNHNETCKYKYWFGLAIHLNSMYPCSLDFDCTSHLCGCDCGCSASSLTATDGIASSSSNRSAHAER